MGTIETLKRAVERGYFIAEDADALGSQARLMEANRETGCEGGFQRLETEVAGDNPSDLKSQAQDMGLWVDYVNPHGKQVCFRFTIPPAGEAQLNYRGLGHDPKGSYLFSTPPPRTPSDALGRAHRSKGIPTYARIAKRLKYR
jgi:hypothetical protein